jgi:hypothetical protein
MLTLCFVMLLGSGFAFLLAKLWFRSDKSDDAAEFLTTFSVDSYRPMERLLSEKDYEFLANQPGFRPGIATELRQERREIFRCYLRQLARDFHRLLGIADLMMVHSAVDRPELAKSISRLRWQFYFNVLNAELRLALYPVVGVPANSGKLIESIGSMYHCLRELAPAAQAA